MVYRFYCRSVQRATRALSKTLDWKMPTVKTGEDALLAIPEIIREKQVGKVLIVTDETMVSLKLIDRLLNPLQSEGHPFALFHKTVPNPTIDNIEEAFTMYKQEGCLGIVAFGGGSALDCAKGVAARVAQPKKSIAKMRGMMKVKEETPLFIAVPTTSGTGSEGTLAAVISNSKTKEKYAIADMMLVPDYAILDPTLTLGLPRQITAETGMDALTHAIEAYIGQSNTEETKRWSLQATKLVFTYLKKAYDNGSDLKARTEMQHAAYRAGLAFTRAYVGNVHAIAHTLGGFYGTPHGRANAVILPHLLRAYGKTVYKPLAELAKAAGVGMERQSDKKRARTFIQAIEQLNEAMGIPETLPEIKKEDISLMAKRAHQEANPHYPVPKIFSKRKFRKMYKRISRDE